jgi:glycogen synthase
LVLGDIPSLREIWDGCAVFVAPDDSAQLISEIHKLIESPASRERLANSAHKRARDFTTERTTSAYLDAYRAARESRGQVCAL